MGRAGPLRGLPAAGLTPESSGPGPCAQSRVTPAPGPRGREGSGVPTVCGLEAPQGAAERHARRGRFPESHSTTGRARPAPAPRTVADVQRRRGAWAPLEAGCYFSISRLDKGAFHEGCPPRGHVERPRAADTAALPGSGPRGACPEKTGWEGPGKREAEVGGGQAAGLDAPPPDPLLPLRGTDTWCPGSRGRCSPRGTVMASGPRVRPWQQPRTSAQSQEPPATRAQLQRPPGAQVGSGSWRLRPPAPPGALRPPEGGRRQGGAGCILRGGGSVQGCCLLLPSAHPRHKIRTPGPGAEPRSSSPCSG